MTHATLAGGTDGGRSLPNGPISPIARPPQDPVAVAANCQSGDPFLSQRMPDEKADWLREDLAFIDRSSKAAGLPFFADLVRTISQGQIERVRKACDLPDDTD